MKLTLEEAIDNVNESNKLLIVKKRMDYGTKNITQSIVSPELVVLLRLHEKIARAAHLLQSGNEAQNESLEDTYQDISCLGVLLQLLSQGNFELELSNK